MENNNIVAPARKPYQPPLLRKRDKLALVSAVTPVGSIIIT